MMCFGLKDRKRLKTNHCVIVLLDDTQLVHELHPTSTGQDLLDVVIKHLNLLETSYFGLKYYLHSSAGPEVGDSRRPVWLDVEQSAIKQLRHISPMTVHFGVKYYASDPCKLAEEITRYQFFLQCKQDILHARLPVSFELAVELFGLAIQSELGDYDPQRHQENYASEFAFLPGQTLELEQRAAHFHRTQLVGQVPATAELNFLEKIKWLDLYGCQLQPIQYDDGDQRDQYALGLGPAGVLVLRNKLKVAGYLWRRIVKTKCQGRCFLMDVLELTADGQADQLLGVAGKVKASDGESGTRRQRFGFRLADKDTSKRLRWAIEEHRHFYYLINSSASLAQLARQQQQQQQQAQQYAQQQEAQLKFGQRFRQSIRSAINLGAHHYQQQQQAQLAALQQLEREQKLRASVKSLHNYARQVAAHEPAPIVRMPSRRYSNRSLPRPSHQHQHQHQSYHHQLANSTGLPVASTLVESERAMALMMANQFNLAEQQLLPGSGRFQQLAPGKSHTLRPISSKEQAKQRALGNNAYYQMMLAMAQQSRNQHQPEVAILPPGQHIVQPAIYRASSVVDGINQLGGVQVQQATLHKQQQQQQQQQQQHQPVMMQQFFNTKPQFACRPESPRSTKSAHVSSSSSGGASQALKMAGKKLAKQQAQLMYNFRSGTGPETRPLLAAYADPATPAADQLAAVYPAEQYYGLGAYSANASPRSTRSGRVAGMAPKFRSKSTGENLHIIHHQQQQQQSFNGHMTNKTNTLNNRMLLATLPVPQSLPPPDYNSSTPTPARASPPPAPASKISGQYYLNGGGGGGDQAPINGKARSNRKYQMQQQDDDYYCSRSDCSSIDQGDGGGADGSRTSYATSGAKDKAGGWAAIRRRHDEFSSGKGPLGRPLPFDSDANNNNHQVAPQQQQQHRLKHIANKQATPILLSMTNTATPPGQNNNAAAANSKAVQLLNMQRQQLHANSRGESDGGSANTRSDSVPSSVASSSPKGEQAGKAQQVSLPTRNMQHLQHHTAADSTTSNSTTTSGYYAGSNSTGPASCDSDTLISGCTDQFKSRQRSTSAANWTPNAHNLLYSAAAAAAAAPGEGTRARIALGVHGTASPKSYGNKQATSASGSQPSTQRKFYLGEQVDQQQQQQQQQWSQQLDGQSGAPASLKYVSFDV